ncbi:MAG: hypothetical protein K0R28_3456, partial [Paenibacillus sp.]|nr:hypothetical protein [Paenibacillus sp.]
PAYDTEGFLSGLEQIVRREGIDWIVPTCEEVFYVSSGLERLGRLCRVFTAPLVQLRRLHSKWSFIRRADELGFVVPATRLLASPAEWSEMMDRTMPEWEDGCVLKPEFSRSGTKVRFALKYALSDRSLKKADHRIPSGIRQYVAWEGMSRTRRKSAIRG